MTPSYLIFIALLISGAIEATTIIHDTGSTHSIDRYMPKKIKNTAYNPKMDQDKQGVIQPNMSVLPIRTQSMKPGKVEYRPHHLPHFQIPFFIFGSDDFSKSWLEERREQLLELKAIGLLVEAESERDVRDMRALTEGLWVFSTSGDDVANEIDLFHYPALISKTGIEQ